MTNHTTRHHRFKRPSAFRQLRPLYIIATEGNKTEPAYFKAFKRRDAAVIIKVLPSGDKSSPSRVVRRAAQYVRKEQPHGEYHVWLVIDRDAWDDAQLRDVCDHCDKEGYHLAVSNPHFEYWLLLHFEDPPGGLRARDVHRRLLVYLPTFDKDHVETRKLRPGINAAIARAKTRDNPPCEAFPAHMGSTVYRLVERLARPQTTVEHRSS